MQPEETAPAPEICVTAAPARDVRLDAVRPPEAVLLPEPPAAAVPVAPVLPEVGESAETVVSPVATEVAAPRRAVPLVAKPLLTEEERQAARRERQERARAEAESAERPALEKKLAALYDASDMLRVMDTELALRRAKRSQGDAGGSRQALRVLSIAALFALLIAALGAMSWMQDRLARTGFSRHRVETVDKK